MQGGHGLRSSGKAIAPNSQTSLQRQSPQSTDLNKATTAAAVDRSLAQKKLNILQQPSVNRNSLNIKAEPQLASQIRIQSDRQKFLKNNLSTTTSHGNVDISVVTSKSMQNKSMNNGYKNSILAASDQQRNRIYQSIVGTKKRGGSRDEPPMQINKFKKK